MTSTVSVLDLQMLDSWHASSTTEDGEDGVRGDLSSTWSSVQHFLHEEDAVNSPGYIPTPAGMDVRASRSKTLSDVGPMKTVYVCLPNLDLGLLLGMVARTVITLNSVGCSFSLFLLASLESTSNSTMRKIQQHVYDSS